MRVFVTFLLISFWIPAAFAGKAAIFSGNDVKTLKARLDLFGEAEIISGQQDPSVTATDARRGSLFLRSGPAGPGLYSKQDNGLTTNWTLVPPAAPTTIDEYSNPSGGTLAGARNGANKVFTVSNAPLAGGLFNVMVDGVVLDPSDWSAVGAVVTLGAGVSAPAVFQSVSVNYQF